MTHSTSCPSSTEVTSLVSHTATYHAQHQDTLIGAFSSTVHGSENNFLPCFIESNVVLSTPRSWESKASTSPCTKPSPGRAYHQPWRASPLYKLYKMMTDHFLELHHLDNTIKSTFVTTWCWTREHSCCPPLENSVRPYQQEMSRVIATHPWHLAGHATSAASHGCRVRTSFSCRTHIHRIIVDHS